MKLLWLLFWLVILAFNTAHSFFPSKLQAKKWIKIAIILVASIILVQSGRQEIDSYFSKSFLHITPSGEVVKNNFPWKVERRAFSEEKPGYLVHYRGDENELVITSDNPAMKPIIRVGYKGVIIEFNCSHEELPGVTIKERK